MTDSIPVRRRIAQRLIIVCASVLLTNAVPAEEVILPGHAVTMTIPVGWERRTNFAAPILVVAVEPATGDSLGLVGLKYPGEKFTLNRKEAETGMLKELGLDGKILRRRDTMLAGVPAYCVIAETRVQGRIISAARIMTEKPINGFLYAAQYSKMGGGYLDDSFIRTIVNRFRVKEFK